MTGHLFKETRFSKNIKQYEVANSAVPAPLVKDGFSPARGLMKSWGPQIMFSFPLLRIRNLQPQNYTRDTIVAFSKECHWPFGRQ